MRSAPLGQCSGRFSSCLRSGKIRGGTTASPYRRHFSSHGLSPECPSACTTSPTTSILPSRYSLIFWFFLVCGRGLSVNTMATAGASRKSFHLSPASPSFLFAPSMDSYTHSGWHASAETIGHQCSWLS
ncbi:hypothetical protein CGCTS75_v005036 [Colletotrichum tropicale]|nr:hypothetical protein CGCTS75_v005036 [Colletotrichum tropicale]